jgi:hypothetical protein
MRDEKGNIVPKDEEAFHLERMRDKAKKANQVAGASTGAISKMNAPSPISRAFRGERVPNMMTRRLRQREQEQEQEPERIAQEQPVAPSRGLPSEEGEQPEPEPVVVKKPLTVKLPDDAKMQLDRMDDDIGTLTQVMKDFLEKNERAKHQDIDALFRNRCANRRTQGFCKLTAKGKLAKGAQLKT